MTKFLWFFMTEKSADIIRLSAFRRATHPKLQDRSEQRREQQRRVDAFLAARAKINVPEISVEELRELSIDVRL